jgi:two-component system, NtrC family, response regulator GlrR
MSDTANKTQPVGSRAPLAPSVRRFRLTVLEGPDADLRWESVDERCAIGQERGNELVLTDTTVSRFHCELEAGDHGVRLKDLGSLNGVLVDGVQVLDGYLKSGSTLRLGRTVLRFEFSHEPNPLKLSTATKFGRLQGTSVALRATFHLMERASSSDVTVLFEGETGTGKSQAARALHEASARREGPFLTLDCGALPPNLIESELFGHEKGAFTGADQRRVGIFEEAKGGTVFLDEIGELPLELQPKLLHVMENREVRRLGGNGFVPVDVRLLAATHRELRAEVNAGRFRADLFYRLAVLRIPLPPLRHHVEDLPAIVASLLTSIGAPAALQQRFTTPEFVGRLAQLAWPGNVRELRNHLERCVVFEEDVQQGGEVLAPPDSMPVDVSRPWAEARKRALDSFERAYVEALLKVHDGNVTRASAAAEMDRAYLHRLMRRSRG